MRFINQTTPTTTNPTMAQIQTAGLGSSPKLTLPDCELDEDWLMAYLRLSTSTPSTTTTRPMPAYSIHLGIPDEATAGAGAGADDGPWTAATTCEAAPPKALM